MKDKILKFIGALALGFVAFGLSGFAVKYSWYWFIAKTFNLQSLTFLQAYGLIVFMTNFYRPKVKKEDKTDVWFDFTLEITLSSLTIIITWILHFII